MTSRDESNALEHFRGRYALPTTDLIEQIEERVIGTVGGVYGYTTFQ